MQYSEALVVPDDKNRLTRVRKCWWCTRPAESPTGCPIRRDGNDGFFSVGIFCGLRCAKAYAVRETGIDPSFAQGPMLLDLLCIRNGLKPVAPAPCPTRLIDFGGDLTYEAYEAALRHEEGKDYSRIGFVDGGAPVYTAVKHYKC